MNREFPKISVMGERSILIEFEPIIDENLLEKLLVYKKLLEKNLIKLKVEVINTYNSLLISYPSNIEDAYSAFSAVKEVLEEAKVVKNIEPKLFHLPVCYDPEFGLDLLHMAGEKNLSISQIISLHTAPFYTVYFLGFLPGFLYLGGLDEKLKISRKEQPRLEVQKGAVGVGENQTGIYPKKSPGGWQIIGNSPVSLFDKNSDPPCEISAGDKVKFFPVSKEEFGEIKSDVEAGKFQIKTEKYESRS